MQIDDITVTVDGIPDMTEHEAESYVRYVEDHTQDKVTSLHLSLAKNGEIRIDYALAEPKFERIRRITGYLVGTIDRWNDAKRAEEHDRVKHGLH